MDAGVLVISEESPGTKGQRCRLTAGQGDLKDSVTENKPPLCRYLRPLFRLLGIGPPSGKGETVW